MDTNKVDKLVAEVAATQEKPRRPRNAAGLQVGLDLGTCYIALVVLDASGRPLACRLEAATAVRDGLVVDYAGAVETTRRLKRDIEATTGLSLDHCAIAVPPGTGVRDSATHRHVAESADMEVVSVVDEPVAANRVLQISDGAVVDIGGGTTGIAVFRDGRLVHSGDEATGGTHLTLVLSGGYRLSFEAAEDMKRDPERQKEVLSAVTPVIEKMATITADHIKGYDVKDVYLVGGTCCLKDIERVMEKVLGLPVHKPANPLLVTPIGIALSCRTDME